MKTIVCGPRDFFDYQIVCAAIKKSGFEITEVVSGKAKGVDTLGEQWARENSVPVKEFPAEWKNLKQEGAKVKKNAWGGDYNSNAGFFRNGVMAKYGEALIAIKTGSGGTGDMIKKMKAEGKPVFSYDPEEHMTDEDFGYQF